MLEPIIYNDSCQYFKIKINAGQQIFKSGGVIRLSDLEYIVSSATTDEKYKVFFNYDENRFNCSCMDAQKYKGQKYYCKHCWAVLFKNNLIL